MKHKLIVTALLFLSPSTDSFAQLYTYEIESMIAVELPTLGGEESEALDVNDSGDVVGWAHMANGVPHGFLLRNGNTVMQDVTSELGPLPAHVRGINNLGFVVGSYETNPDNAHSRAFFWAEGSPLKTLPPPFEYSRAHAINMLGRIVGEKYGPVPGNPGSPCTGLLPVQWQDAYAWYEMLYCATGVELADRRLDQRFSGLESCVDLEERPSAMGAEAGNADLLAARARREQFRRSGGSRDALRVVQ